MSTLETKIPNLDTQKRIASALETIAGDGLKQWNLETNHPVGTTWESIYPVNPADILGGGTWKQLKDVTIVAAGDKFKVSDLDTNQDGGEVEHTLTVDEMPAHNHKENDWLTSSANSFSGMAAQMSTVKNAYNVLTPINFTGARYTGNTGGGTAHNNMQPYKVLYKWIRTA